jgi:hypothetical protein
MKIRMTFTVEYEVEPDDYSPGTTPEEMLAVDILNAQDDPQQFIYGAKVTGEIIP